MLLDCRLSPALRASARGLFNPHPWEEPGVGRTARRTRASKGWPPWAISCRHSTARSPWPSCAGIRLISSAGAAAASRSRRGARRPWLQLDFRSAEILSEAECTQPSESGQVSAKADLGLARASFARAGRSLHLCPCSAESPEKSSTDAGFLRRCGSAAGGVAAPSCVVRLPLRFAPVASEGASSGPPGQHWPMSQVPHCVVIDGDR